MTLQHTKTEFLSAFSIQCKHIKKTQDDKQLGRLLVERAYTSYVSIRLNELKQYNLTYIDKLHQIAYEWDDKLSIDQKAQYLK